MGQERRGRPKGVNGESELSIQLRAQRTKENLSNKLGFDIRVVARRWYRRKLLEELRHDETSPNESRHLS